MWQVGVKGILIPSDLLESGPTDQCRCQCPPSLDSFIANLGENVAAGHVVNNTAVSLTFPTGSSKADRLARMHAQTVTLQSLRGPGVCDARRDAGPTIGLLKHDRAFTADAAQASAVRKLLRRGAPSWPRSRLHDRLRSTAARSRAYAPVSSRRSPLSPFHCSEPASWTILLYPVRFFVARSRACRHGATLSPSRV